MHSAFAAHSMIRDIRKAAVLLSSLPLEARARLLSELEPRLSAAVSVQMAELGTVRPEESQSAAADFVAAALPLDCDEESTEPASRCRTADGVLGVVADRQLLAALIEEQPTIIAAVLQNLPEERAARILASLPQPLRLTVVRRLAILGPIAFDVVRDIEWAIVERVSTASVPLPPVGYSIFRIAAILEVADFQTRHDLLCRLAMEDPHLAAAICQRLRIFCEIDQRDCGKESIAEDNHRAREAA